MIEMLEKIFFNKYAIWTETPSALGLLIVSTIKVMTGDFLPVWLAFFMLICIPLLLAVVISLKGEVDGIRNIIQSNSMGVWKYTCCTHSGNICINILPRKKGKRGWTEE